MKVPSDMKRIMILGVFALSLLLSGGCDFLRTVAGRPTSTELQSKRAAIAVREMEEREAEARERHVRDSLAAVEKHRTDSVAAETFFKESRVSRLRTGSFPGLLTDGFPQKYCIILAGFSQPQNAEQFSAKLKEAGYTPLILHYVRGTRSMVGIDPTDDPAALRATYEKVRAEKFCPRDAWILVNE